MKLKVTNGLGNKWMVFIKVFLIFILVFQLTGLHAVANSVTSELTEDSSNWTVPIRINVNGGEYIDADGNKWLADQPYEQGGWGYRLFHGINNIAQDIAGTVDDELYQTYRMFGNLGGYQFDLPEGEYEITLKMVDDWTVIAQTIKHIQK